MKIMKNIVNDIITELLKEKEMISPDLLFLDLDRRKQRSKIILDLMNMKNNIDISWVAHPKFNLKQIEIIATGLRDGIDVSLYANPYMNFSIMYILYRMLNEKIHTFNVLFEIIEHSKKFGFDIQIFEKTPSDEENSNNSNLYHVRLSNFLINILKFNLFEKINKDFISFIVSLTSSGLSSEPPDASIIKNIIFMVISGKETSLNRVVNRINFLKIQRNEINCNILIDFILLLASNLSDDVSDDEIINIISELLIDDNLKSENTNTILSGLNDLIETYGINNVIKNVIRLYKIDKNLLIKFFDLYQKKSKVKYLYIVLEKIENKDSLHKLLLNYENMFMNISINSGFDISTYIELLNQNRDVCDYLYYDFKYKAYDYVYTPNFLNKLMALIKTRTDFKDELHNFTANLILNLNIDKNSDNYYIGSQSVNLIQILLDMFLNIIINTNDLKNLKEINQLLLHESIKNIKKTTHYFLVVYAIIIGKLQNIDCNVIINNLDEIFKLIEDAQIDDKLNPRDHESIVFYNIYNLVQNYNYKK